MKYDFKHIVDFIFKHKEKYSELSYDDKTENFFIINRKFCRQFPQYAQTFNKKSIDKSIALDMWYYFIIKKRITGIPDWYWFKLSKKKDKSILKPDEKLFLMEFYDISEKDIDFLTQHYPNDVKEEIKKYNKLNKN